MQKFFWFIKTKLYYKLRFGKIGKKSYVAKPLFLKNTKKILLGNKVRIFPGMRAEVHLNGSIKFEDDISVGQNLHIISGGNLTIGSGTTISSNVFISNVDHTFSKDTSCLKNELKVKETKIGNCCFIGVGAVILPGTILGNNVIVGANATVKGVFPDNCIIAGTPAKIVKEVY